MRLVSLLVTNRFSEFLPFSPPPKPRAVLQPLASDPASDNVAHAIVRAAGSGLRAIPAPLTVLRAEPRAAPLRPERDQRGLPGPIEPQSPHCKASSSPPAVHRRRNASRQTAPSRRSIWRTASVAASRPRLPPPRVHLSAMWRHHFARQRPCLRAWRRRRALRRASRACHAHGAAARPRSSRCAVASFRWRARR